MAALVVPVAGLPRRADGFAAVEHQGRSVYRFPEKPRFTSRVGGRPMPAGSPIVVFTRAMGSVKGRADAPKEVREKLTWPPGGSPASI